jgi:hypothetical protein
MGGYHWSCRRGEPRRCDVFYLFLDRSVHCQIPRALYGNWTGPHNAAVFREQCDLSIEHDAGVVTLPVL